MGRMDEAAQPDSPVPFITRVRIKNFRSIAECDVTLGPLTVLVGPNAAGKSNFLDAIKFVIDAVTTSLEQAISQRGGLDALLHRRSGSHARSFQIRLQSTAQAQQGKAPEHASYEIEIGHDNNGRIAVLSEKWRCRDLLSASHFSRITGGDGRTEYAGDIGTAHDLPQHELIASVHSRLDLRPLLNSSWAPFKSARFYDLDTGVLRALDETPLEARGSVLGPSGQHLGHLLGMLAAEHPMVKQTVDGYLAAIIDNCLGVDQKMEGRYPTVSARFVTAGRRFEDPTVEVFERESLSEGTLRLAGVLVALFQPRALTGDISLNVIEEPEKAIHPPRLGALYEAMIAAANSTQVIVSTQSADLLDSEAASTDHLLVAVNEDGTTRMGPLDQAGVSLVADKIVSVSELLRNGLMRPAPAEGDGW